MKILSIKKRNPVVTAFTIEHYKVVVEDDDGKVHKLNCWAGRNNPEAENILFDIDKHLGSRLLGKHLKGEHIEGYEKVELVVENKVVQKLVNGNIVINVGTQQNADAIAQNLRNQAQNAKSTGIRYGK